MMYAKKYITQLLVVLFIAILTPSLVFPQLAPPDISLNRAAVGSGGRVKVDKPCLRRERRDRRVFRTSENERRKRFSTSYVKLPLSFEANQGQSDEHVKFLSRGSGYSLFLTSTEAVLALKSVPQGRRDANLARGAEEHGCRREFSPLLFCSPAPLLKYASSREKECDLFPREVYEPLNPLTVVRIKLAGANPNPHVSGIERLPGKSNYFIGNDPEKWRTNIPHYSKVRYENVYPGVDMIYYGASQRQLEYDFIIAPNADYKAITLEIRGAQEIELDAQGDLLLHTAGGQIRLRKPLVYQEGDGVKHEIPGGYVLFEDITNHAKSVRFCISPYDIAKPLIIDPELVYSTYLGGRALDRGTDIAVDAAGNAYITGLTFSYSNFPIAGNPPFQPDYGGGSYDAFVSKISVDGSALVYSSYLGGGRIENFLAAGIAVDDEGNAYLTGQTYSADFPMVNPLQLDNKGGSDAFVAKLNAAGSALVYSTYLGGSEDDIGYDITVDGARSAYVIGKTVSSDFMTASPLQPANNGESDAFVAKLSVDGSELVYSTYLGGEKAEDFFRGGIAVDSTGSAYVTGWTESRDFPTVNALEPDYGGGVYDAFVAKLNPTGASLVNSTYLGGNDDDKGHDIEVDISGSVYVVGLTASEDFPTINSLQSDYGGGIYDAFVAKLNPTGSSLVYSTYLGGSDKDEGRGIAVDALGRAYVTGATSSVNFPLEEAIQENIGGLGYDAFIAELVSAGTSLVYSTYLGGAMSDKGNSVALDAANNAYITGWSRSEDFPMANPFQRTYGGDGDAFIAKIKGLGYRESRIELPSETEPETAQYSHAITRTGTLEAETAPGSNDFQPLEGQTVRVIFTPRTAQTPPVEETDVTDALGNFEVMTRLYSLDTWDVKAVFDGDIDRNIAISSEDYQQPIIVQEAIGLLTLNVESERLWVGQSMRISGTLNTTQVGLRVSGARITLSVQGPNAQGNGQTVETTTNEEGAYSFDNFPDPADYPGLDPVPFGEPGEWTLQVSFESDDLHTGVSPIEQIDVFERSGYVIIVTGKVRSNEGLENHSLSTNSIYRAFAARGFTADRIRYLNFDTDQSDNCDPTGRGNQT